MIPAKYFCTHSDIPSLYIIRFDNALTEKSNFWFLLAVLTNKKYRFDEGYRYCKEKKKLTFERPNLTSEIKSGKSAVLVPSHGTCNLKLHYFTHLVKEATWTSTINRRQASHNGRRMTVTV